MNENIIKNVVSKFDIDGEFESFLPYGNGHINSTYVVNLKNSTVKRILLQKINTTIFKQPIKLMDNVLSVTNYLGKIIDKDKKTLVVIMSKDDKHHVISDDNSFFRMYHFIENSMDFQAPENAKDVYLTGKAFGDFIKDLDGFEAKSLHETIENFHNTKNRFTLFEEAIKNDPLNRVKDISDEIDFAFKRKDKTSILVDLIENKKLPLRVTHNDTKLNNILFDKDTKKPVCIVDLDTVMPGLFLYDYGDSARTSITFALEDETNLDKVYMDKELFKALTNGYLESLKDVLTKEEINQMPLSTFLMTFECGIRFLTDYINGDIYFSISSPDHNLVRAKNQFKLALSMEENMDFMKEYINSILN